MDIDPPTALVPPGSSPNVHIDDSVVSGDVLVPVDNTEVRVSCYLHVLIS